MVAVNEGGIIFSRASHPPRLTSLGLLAGSYPGNILSLVAEAMGREDGRGHEPAFFVVVGALTQAGKEVSLEEKRTQTRAGREIPHG